MTQVDNRWHLTWDREKEESVQYQPLNKTKGRDNGPKAHKKARPRIKGSPLVYCNAILLKLHWDKGGLTSFTE